MNQEDFITAIKLVVHDASIKGMDSTLSRPSGQRPHEKLKEISEWFNGQPGSDKEQIMEVVRLSVLQYALRCGRRHGH